MVQGRKEGRCSVVFPPPVFFLLFSSTEFSSEYREAKKIKVTRGAAVGQFCDNEDLVQVDMVEDCTFF